jgi:hypothetical protein
MWKKEEKGENDKKYFYVLKNQVYYLLKIYIFVKN